MKAPQAPPLERWEQEWPPDRRKLIPHASGCLVVPGHEHVAYCPKCLMSFHPDYFPRHSSKECKQYALEFVEEVMGT